MQKGKTGKLCLTRIFIIISSVVFMFSILISVCIASEPSTESHLEIEAKHEIKHNHVAVFVGGMSPVSGSNKTFLALGLRELEKNNHPEQPGEMVKNHFSNDGIRSTN